MTAAAILKRQRAGFNEEQVEARAAYFDEQLVTKADLAAAEARLETNIEQARGDTIKWVIGVGFAQAATILAVLRLFPGHP
jgi:hypothetical protein